MNLKVLFTAGALALGIPAVAAAQTPMGVEVAPGVTATVLGIKRVPGQDLVQLDYEIANNSGHRSMCDLFGLLRRANQRRDVVTGT